MIVDQHEHYSKIGNAMVTEVVEVQEFKFSAETLDSLRQLL